MTFESRTLFKLRNGFFRRDGFFAAGARAIFLYSKAGLPMARTLLSGIAIAAGTGLAIGYGFTFGRRAHSRKGRPASFRETAAVRASLEEHG